MKENIHARAIAARHNSRYAVILPALLFCLGCVLELLTGGKGAPRLAFPMNAAFLVVLAMFITALRLLSKNNPLVRFLSSTRAAISITTFYLAMLVLMGLLPQGQLSPHSLPFSQVSRQLGPLGALGISVFKLSTIRSSWQFALLTLLLLLSLGLVILRRGFPRDLRSTSFQLNHLGLWLTIAAMMAGAGDFLELSMTASKKDYTWQARDPWGRIYDLPLAVRLDEFEVDYWPPKLALSDKLSGHLLHRAGNPLPDAAADSTYLLKNWQLKTSTYFREAGWFGNTFKKARAPGLAPAILVSASNIITGSTHSGWLSSGGSIIPGKNLNLSPQYDLVMLAPQPRRYQSTLSILQKGAAHARKDILEVNKPLSVGEWDIYQLSYDTRMGSYSEISILRLVRDPWLPLVYTGIFLLLTGAVSLFVLSGRLAGLKTISTSNEQNSVRKDA
jgi:hypothetical protein